MIELFELLEKNLAWEKKKRHNVNGFACPFYPD